MSEGNAGQTVKPDPRLGTESAGIVTRFRNVIWLLIRVAREEPRTALLWVAMAFLGGMLVPVQLWSGKGVVDNLQDRLEGGTGFSLWWYAAAWTCAMSLVLITEQVEGIFAATAQERGGSAIAGATLTKATRIDLASFEHQDFMIGSPWYSPTPKRKPGRY